MALSKEERLALPGDDFAVPNKRALPMHDAKHVRMAWDMVDRTKDLSDEERTGARHRILEKAKALGIDTADWSTIKAMAFDAMSLAVPHTDDHPNKMPFTGILTRIDQPSDAPPHGSNGRRVLLPRDVAEKALPSLLGMAVDLKADFAGHNAQNKIGLICEANIEGDAITIGGFIYAADFPDAAARIRAMKDDLGFSFEMKSVRVADPGADPLVIESCVFTGAAILKKKDAAYQTTSLAASAEAEEITMTKEEMQEFLAGALKPITDKLAQIEAGQAAVAADLAAGKETHAKIKPHADALRACAASMDAAGVGGHATLGPSARLGRMADTMEAQAMVGKLPHIYRDHDFMVDAAAGETLKPAEPPKVDLSGIEASIAALGTKLTDLQAKAFTDAAVPERKTLPGDVLRLLAKSGAELDASGEKKVTVAQFDGFLDKADIHGTEATKLKLQAREAGLIAA